MIAVRPVVAAARDQAHAVAVALDAEAVAIVFHLAEPVGPSGTVLAFVGTQNSNDLNMVRR